MSVNGKQKIETSGKKRMQSASLSEDRAVSAAVAVLESKLRQPNEQFLFHWCHSSLSGREIIDINSVYPLVLAWSRIDPATAESILKGVFYLQDSSGAIYSRYLPDGTALTTETPWPLLIQAVGKIWKMNGNADFLKTIMPRVYRYADWICYHFDQNASGTPCWSSNEEALIADSYQSGTATPDLAILLLGELNALASLENDQPRIFQDKLYLKPETDKLIKLIQNRFWDRTRNSFRIIPLDGGADLPAPVFFSALAALPGNISPEIRIQAKPILAKALKLFDKSDIWPGGINFQINPVYAFLLIAAAESAGMHAECIEFCRKTKRFISNSYRQLGTMPDELSGRRPAANGLQQSRAPAQSPPTMSALSVYMEGLLLDYGRASSRPASLLYRLNRHPALFGILPFSLLAVLVAAISLANIFRSDPTGSSLEAGLGLAKHYYSTGKYDEVLKISEALSAHYRKSNHPDMMRAKALYKLGKYREAEQIYSRMLEKESAHPFLKLNIALLKYKQNRFDEAITIYTDFIEDYGEDLPYERGRAAAAVELLRKSKSFGEGNGDG